MTRVLWALGLLLAASAAQAQTGHGYTATRFVAPGSTLSGTPADTADQGSTAWAAATNPATPVTFGTALARATAGTIVELAPGSYNGACPGNASSPVFGASNAGSSGNVTRFVAQYPAALNQGNSALWTQLKRDDDPDLDTCPLVGAQHYIDYDGFYFDYADGGLPHTRGIYYFGYQLNGAEAHRWLVDRTDLGSSDDGDNYNVFHVHGSTGVVIANNVIRNGFDDTGSHNEAVITLYGAQNFLINNNTFSNVTIPIYVKGTDGGNGNWGRITQNLMTDVKIGIELSTTADSPVTDVVEVDQNIITLSTVSSTHALAWENATGVPRYFFVHHNTLIGTDDEEQGVVAVESGVDPTGSVFRDNIVARFRNGGGQVMVNAQNALTNFTAWDYNLYYDFGGTPQFYLGSNRNGLAAWQSASSRDANSSVADPGFVDQANGDYHLDTGSPALTASSTSGPVGAYITGDETIGADGQAADPDPPSTGAPVRLRIRP